MQTFEHISSIVEDIFFPGMTLIIKKEESGRIYIQVEMMGKCVDTGELLLQKGRKWDISLYAIDDEIVGTAFLAIRTFWEHEIRENFTYKGRRVFGPHMALQGLMRLCDEGAIATR